MIGKLYMFEVNVTGGIELEARVYSTYQIGKTVGLPDGVSCERLLWSWYHMVSEAPPSLVVPSYNFWGPCRLSCISNRRRWARARSPGGKAASLLCSALAANLWWIPGQTAAGNSVLKG